MLSGGWKTKDLPLATEKVDNSPADKEEGTNYNAST